MSDTEDTNDTNIRRAKLAKRVVDAAKPEEHRYVIWDEILKGFGLQILPTGNKSYVFDYRTAEGRPKRPTIGKTSALTPDEAREIAKDYAAKVRAGGDPQADRENRRDALTVSAMLDLYAASPKFTGKSQEKQKIDSGQIERHLKPLLGKRHADQLDQDDIRRAFAGIRDGKTAGEYKTGPRGLARVTGGEGAARYAIRLLRAAFVWATEQRPKPLVSENPCIGVDIGVDGEREIHLEAKHYQQLYETLDRQEAEHRLRSDDADLFRLYALTGARQSEMVRLRWRYVDLKAGRIVLPPTRHKTGAKTRKPKVISLPAAAQAIIARQPEGKPDDLVFPPSNGKGFKSPKRAWRKVRTEAKLPDYVDGKPIGTHGLRHGVGSWLAMGGAQEQQIMTVLGHKQSSTVQRYIHMANETKAALAERAAGPALAGMAAAAGDPKATVTPLKGAKRS